MPDTPASKRSIDIPPPALSLLTPQFSTAQGHSESHLLGHTSLQYKSSFAFGKSERCGSIPHTVDSVASEPSTKARFDKAQTPYIIMGEENTTIATDVQGTAAATQAESETTATTAAAAEVTAESEIIATIVNVQEYQNRYFLELSKSFEARDDKGKPTTTNTISKGGRSILAAIKSPIAKAIQAKCNGRPEDYDICSLIGLLCIGGEIHFTRTLIQAGDIIPESDNRKATAECFATKVLSIKVDCSDVMPFIMEGIKTIEKREKTEINPFAI